MISASFVQDMRVRGASVTESRVSSVVDICFSKKKMEVCVRVVYVRATLATGVYRASKSVVWLNLT